MKAHICFLFIAISTICQIHYGESKLSPHELYQFEKFTLDQFENTTALIKSKFPNGKVGNQTFEQIFGNGFDFAVFGCESPQVYDWDLPPESFKFKRQYEYLMATVKSKYKCDPMSDTWRRPEDNAFVTFNIKTNKFQIFVQTGTFQALKEMGIKYNEKYCRFYMKVVRLDFIPIVSIRCY